MDTRCQRCHTPIPRGSDHCIACGYDPSAGGVEVPAGGRRLPPPDLDAGPPGYFEPPTYGHGPKLRPPGHVPSPRDGGYRGVDGREDAGWWVRWSGADAVPPAMGEPVVIYPGGGDGTEDHGGVDDAGGHGDDEHGPVRRGGRDEVLIDLRDMDLDRREASTPTAETDGRAGEARLFTGPRRSGENGPGESRSLRTVRSVVVVSVAMLVALVVAVVALARLLM